MDKSSKPAKPSYPELIRARAEKLYAEAREAGSSDKSIQLIFDALKATALESWKNGLDAGRRRAGKPASPAKTA